jgi:hypothetical protein
MPCSRAIFDVMDCLLPEQLAAESLVLIIAPVFGLTPESLSLAPACRERRCLEAAFAVRAYFFVTLSEKKRCAPAVATWLREALSLSC